MARKREHPCADRHNYPIVSLSDPESTHTNDEPHEEGESNQTGPHSDVEEPIVNTVLDSVISVPLFEVAADLVV